MFGDNPHSLEPFKNKFDKYNFAYWSGLCHMCDSMVKGTGAHCNCVFL